MDELEEKMSEIYLCEWGRDMIRDSGRHTSHTMRTRGKSTTMDLAGTITHSARRLVMDRKDKMAVEWSLAVKFMFGFIPVASHCRSSIP